MALYNVIWSYIGYSNANYALSETKNPVRTLKIAAPLAIGAISILYMLVNIAYFAAVPKEEILAARQLVAAAMFKNVFGGTAERALSVFVALSAFGNVLSVTFSQGRLVQELGREGILPFSRFWASNRPFNAPTAGLLEHYLVSVIIMLAPPYYLHCVVGMGIVVAGGFYWLVWAVILPKIFGYELVQKVVVDDIDGWERNVFFGKPLHHHE